MQMQRKSSGGDPTPSTRSSILPRARHYRNGTDIKIAHIPYKSTDRQSKVALAWLLEQQEELREWFQDGSICIQHAFNSYSEVIADFLPR
jgi:hypothetical protein